MLKNLKLKKNKNKKKITSLYTVFLQKRKKKPCSSAYHYFEHAILAIYKINPIIEVYKAHISHTLLKVFTLFPIESFILRTRCKQS